MTDSTDFEAHRGHLRAVAYRMLGSTSEADDAVQEAWLRLARAGGDAIENLRGWLTTVVARVCLDMLRARKARREDGAAAIAELDAAHGAQPDPASEAALADSVGLALLVVLDTLAPAERLAFVLHDMFAVSFDEIAAIVGRSPAAARQLASRARRRLHGAPAVPEAELARQRRVVDAFLRALRAGDFAGLIAVLDPDVVVRGGGDGDGDTRERRGAAAWARGAFAFRAAHPEVADTVAALVDGEPAAVVARDGAIRNALLLTFDGDRIVEIEIVTQPERVRAFEVELLA